MSRLNCTAPGAGAGGEGATGSAAANRPTAAKAASARPARTAWAAHANQPDLMSTINTAVHRPRPPDGVQVRSTRPGTPAGRPNTGEHRTQVTFGKLKLWIRRSDAPLCGAGPEGRRGGSGSPGANEGRGASAVRPPLRFRFGRSIRAHPSRSAVEPGDTRGIRRASFGDPAQRLTLRSSGHRGVRG